LTSRHQQEIQEKWAGCRCRLLTRHWKETGAIDCLFYIILLLSIYVYSTLQNSTVQVLIAVQINPLVGDLSFFSIKAAITPLSSKLVIEVSVEIMYCNLCDVDCPSSYQYDQHIQGRKHNDRLQGKAPKGRGVCFYFAQGKCYKGNACTFLHTSVGVSGPSSYSSATKSKPSYCEPTLNLITPGKPETMDDFVADIFLCKGGQNDPDAGLAPIFRKRSASVDNKESRFPEVYRNAFHRKRNVNLYIRQDVGVVFEFAYNTKIIQAVKDHIKGRAWNPTMKCWTCPLESLPDAIALYEHMGRTVDDSLQQRAKELAQTIGTTSTSSDDIQLSLQLEETSSTNPETDLDTQTTTNTIGTIRLKFLFDAGIVASLKKVSPSQRTYDPATKIWTVDVLALHELLDHLQPLGYTPCQKLQELAQSCTKVQELVSAAQENDDPDGFKAALMDLFRLVNQAKGNATPVDRSSCGQAKRRKLLTLSQRQWAQKKSDDWSSDKENLSDSEEDGFGLVFRAFHRSLLSTRLATPPPDCDCGWPNKTVGGRHVCRYFGTFECDSCCNQWTSAYCWKGEKQACRRCNQESLPVKKDKLDGRAPVDGVGGGHDSERCAMCRRLGYNCNRYS
jgi:Zinc-finger of C2H2 type